MNGTNTIVAASAGTVFAGYEKEKDVKVSLFATASGPGGVFSKDSTSLFKTRDLSATAGLPLFANNQSSSPTGGSTRVAAAVSRLESAAATSEAHPHGLSKLPASGGMGASGSSTAAGSMFLPPLSPSGTQMQGTATWAAKERDAKVGSSIPVSPGGAHSGTRTGSAHGHGATPSASAVDKWSELGAFTASFKASAAGAADGATPALNSTAPASVFSLAAASGLRPSAGAATSKQQPLFQFGSKAM